MQSHSVASSTYFILLSQNRESVRKSYPWIEVNFFNKLGNHFVYFKLFTEQDSYKKLELNFGELSVRILLVIN